MARFFDEGLRFECKRCSHCCRAEPGFVFLSQSDLTKLCKWFNLNEERFIKTYCRFVPRGGGEAVLSLREKRNYDCILWNDGCTAYAARPVQCATYPFWTGFLADKESWEKEGGSCPGINGGTLRSKESICAAQSAYEQNAPLVFAHGRKAT